METLRQESRADKREVVKRAKKKAEFAQKLTPIQKEYIEDLVKAGKEGTRVRLLNTFDICVQGALIEKSNLTYEEICNVVYKAGELMKESYEVLENVSLEERKMSVESLKNEVAEKISEMIFEGKERKDIVKQIRAEYKGTGLTTAEINVFYKKGLEAFNEFVKKENLEVIKDTTKDKEPVKENKFKVINKVVKVVEADIAGEHGNYHIENGVLNIKDTELAFANVAALKNWASDEREALLKRLDSLNNLENEVEEVFKEFM